MVRFGGNGSVPSVIAESVKGGVKWRVRNGVRVQGEAEVQSKMQVQGRMIRQNALSRILEENFLVFQCRYKSS